MASDGSPFFQVNSARGGTHLRVFFAKSSELHENKRVEFLGGARKRKRVWNSLKRKDLNIVRSDQ